MYCGDNNCVFEGADNVCDNCNSILNYDNILYGIEINHNSFIYLDFYQNGLHKINYLLNENSKFITSIENEKWAKFSNNERYLFFKKILDNLEFI